MSMRLRAAAAILSIILVFTVASYYSNMYFNKNTIREAIKQDLALARDVADALASAKIELLLADASTLAERLLQVSSIQEMPAIIEAHLDEFPDFISLSVYDQTSIVISCGEPDNHDIFKAEGSYLQRAYEGVSTLTSTHYNSISGAFIMHVIVPMGKEWVLSATIPGTIFSDLFSRYRLWESGSIFMLDGEGTIIAFYNEDMVFERRNFIKEAKTNPMHKSVGDFFQTILDAEGDGKGHGTYEYLSRERFCAYSRVSSSNTGWRIAVMVPTNETPESKIKKNMRNSSLLFIGVGILISIFVSGLAAKPFYKIEAQNRDLAELVDIIQTSSEAKSIFLANMSHEMRTPLNAIIGLSEITLEIDDLDEEVHANIDKVYNSGMTLLSTVNDILDISKIEAGKFELIPVVYDVPSMINDAVVQNTLQIGEKPIKFVLSIDENLPMLLRGDELRLKQILNNLLSNAIKYTNEGIVELCINTYQEYVAEDGIVVMTILVRDTGIGIRAENLGTLFENYAQMDLKANRNIKGTGLGLPITKMLTDLMGGSISVESKFGEGTTLTVRLMQEFVTEKVIGPEIVESLTSFHYSSKSRLKSSKEERIALSYARVLIVDDMETNLFVARGLMKPYKMHVDCVTSGVEAVNLMRDEKVRYDAIFLDHMMPEMDGIETLQAIRKLGTEYAKTIPIIAFTANAVVGNEDMFLKKGFQAFISKPIKTTRLDEIIREWIRDEDKEKELGLTGAGQGLDPMQVLASGQVLELRSGVERRSGIDRRTINMGMAGLDMEKGINYFAGDEEAYFEVLRSFAASVPIRLEKIKEVREDELADYATIVHGIKGAGRTIFAKGVADIAEALEKQAKSGNYEFVVTHNPDLITSASKLVSEIDEKLLQLSMSNPKPRRDKPDEEILHSLLGACKSYDMDGVDTAVAALDEYEYESEPDRNLVALLLRDAERMNFAEIIEELTQFLKGDAENG